VERPRGAPEDLYVVTVDAPEREAWQRVVKSLEPGAFAAPVVRDEHGNESYPTGVVAVRFHEAPPEDGLAEFLKRHELVLVDRNRYVGEQVRVRAAGGATFLPALLADLGTDDRVRKAWAETLTAYRRSS
jgi:hypothetical protein